MASNITLSYFGPPEQKHVIKVPPMQTLSQVLEAAASKFKPALVPQQCSLQYSKKPVDLNTPFRLLNVPAGSKLEVIISRPQQAAPSAAPGTPAAPAVQQVAVPSAPAPGAAAAAPAATAAPPPAAAAAHARSAASAALAAVQPPAPAPAAAEQQQLRAGQAAAAAAAAPPPAAAPQAEAGVGPSSTAAAEAGSAGDTPSLSPLAALGVTGQVYVFHQRTLEAAAAEGPSPMELDFPDDFFELTTDDLVRLQQQANEKKRQEAMFRPRALREAEQAARAATLGPVPVRLHFPDATIVQASFNASQPLSAVHQLVTQLALEAVAPALYLYTTPPKTVLKDPTATLYQLKLVPAAHVYVGCEVKRLKASAQAAVAAGSYAGPCLRPEVMALMQEGVPQQQGVQQDAAPRGQQGSSSDVEASAADAQRVLAAAAAASRTEGGGSRGAAGAGGAKVPKWLKMGK